MDEVDKKYHREYKRRKRLEDPEYSKREASHMRDLRHNNPTYRKNENKARRKLNLKNKLICLNHYSNNNIKCACCGENHIEFMGIDHTKGGGGKHRKEIKKRGSAFYAWLIKEEFPEGYRVLCFNCNLSLGLFGHCPHNSEK